MRFVVICKDKPGHLQLRIDTRPAHVAHLETLNASGVLGLAGPFLDADGKPNGSMGVVEADDLDAARALLAGDPYAKAGLFASFDVRPWNWTVNKPAEV